MPYLDLQQLVSTCRYFCSHNAGIHLVNVPMANQLDHYVAASEGNYYHWISFSKGRLKFSSLLDCIQLQLPNLVRQSSAQYLVTTRTKYTGKQEATPILGFGLLQEPCILVALLHTGQVIDISVVDYYFISNPESATLPLSPTKKVKLFISHLLVSIIFIFFMRFFALYYQGDQRTLWLSHKTVAQEGCLPTDNYDRSTAKSHSSRVPWGKILTPRICFLFILPIYF